MAYHVGAPFKLLLQIIQNKELNLLSLFLNAGYKLLADFLVSHKNTLEGVWLTNGKQGEE